jgi:hypothetical protein
MKNISGAQLQALHVLYSRFAEHVHDGETLNEDAGRHRRLAWAQEQLGRPVDSFRNLTMNDAAKLIDSLKSLLGQPVIAPRRPPRSRSRQRDSKVVAMATQHDFRKVELLREAYGMTVEQFDHWLASPHSPTQGRKLVTAANCRAVCVALRQMLRRRSLKCAG